jgi:hypothetical protein
MISFLYGYWEYLAQIPQAFNYHGLIPLQQSFCSRKFYEDGL